MKKFVAMSMFLLLLVITVIYIYTNKPFLPGMRSIEVVQPNGASDFTRKLQGKFKEFNLEKESVKIEGKSGEIYVFLVPSALIDNSDESLYLPVDTMVEVKWRDEATMEQIFKRFKTDPSLPINPDINSFQMEKLK